MIQSRPRVSRKTVLIFTVLWGVVLAGGFTALLAYQLYQPPLPHAAHRMDEVQDLVKIPGLLPQATRDLSSTGFDSKTSVFFFFHPNCPCTAATIIELERVIAQNGGADRVQPKLYAFVYCPAEAGASWTNTASINQARAIPGLTLIDDPDARMARRFGAAVSGQVLMYGADGTLVFNGGITESRGHEGDNPGLDQLRGFLSGKTPGIASFPVFGCFLYQI